MIQQVAFEVPAEIAVGLATGKYVQWGGVVRDGAGHIVRHLSLQMFKMGLIKRCV